MVTTRDPRQLCLFPFRLSCMVAGCSDPVLARKLCRVHYARFRQHGDPLGGRWRFKRGGACKVANCHRSALSLGLCGKHYRALLYHGDPLYCRQTVADFIKSLLGHAGDACVDWPFSKNDGGYPVIRRGKKTIFAHREACRLAHGDPPPDKPQAAHNCGRRLCVNPNHLRWASYIENAADKLIHGTHNRGERAGRATLTDEAARTVKRRLRQGESNRNIARDLKVHPRTIYEIKRGQTWKYVEEESADARAI